MALYQKQTTAWLTKIKSKDEADIIIELTVQINHELIALLFSYMDAIEILEPEGLRKRFKSISETLYKNIFELCTCTA